MIRYPPRVLRVALVTSHVWGVDVEAEATRVAEGPEGSSVGIIVSEGSYLYFLVANGRQEALLELKLGVQERIPVLE